MNYKRFNLEQLDILREGMEAGLDIRWYYNYNFSVEQMKLIRDSLADGIDVRYISNPKFSIEQMNLILEGQKEGLDVSLYANAKYNIYKMRTIKACLENEVDIKFANKGYTISQIKYYEKDINDSSKQHIEEYKYQIFSLLKTYIDTLHKNKTDVLKKK